MSACTRDVLSVSSGMLQLRSIQLRSGPMLPLVRR